MATVTRALSQISIIDLTDGYTVSLSQDSGSFAANSNHRAINTTTVFSIIIQALQGGKSISKTVKIGTCVIKDASGNTISNGTITASADPGNVSPVTITVHGNANADTGAFIGQMATVTIPVYVEGDPSNPNDNTDIKINKTFTISSSPQGAAGAAGTSSYTWIRYAEDDKGTGINEDPADSRPYMAILVTNSSTPPQASAFVGLWTKYLGQDGTNGTNGEDGVTYVITSSNGTYFKNTAVRTKLTVHIYKADGTEMAVPSNLKWYKGDPNNGGVLVPAADHPSYIDIGPNDVTNTATYFVVLETEEEE